ncbi:DUF2007 domain-containing protein [Arenibacter sp. 6A1]|uniref:DUF2007 domain-containing protein n=1 Tax=Arenibacter sp. 6A1 TaxID=2720391 RepID=UPI0014471A84|nr:DUF2007 domain-containing protein [Arenibacter sp. 6A1]NKI26343.1 DUF2007 domain-containing protein [Arenibacter sp. 6A1]
MNSDYNHIFSGNFIIASRIIAELKLSGINPIVKDESESGRLAGFASPMQGDLEIYVQLTEADKAKNLVQKILAAIDSQ